VAHLRRAACFVSLKHGPNKARRAISFCFLYSAPVDDAQVQKFEDEIVRLQEMLEGFKTEDRHVRYVPLVGLALAVPSYFWQPWAPALVMACAFVVMGTWWYLIYGHVNERTFQLEQLRLELAKVGKASMHFANDSSPDPEKIRDSRIKQSRLL
jgi:hypothetical protein